MKSYVSEFFVMWKGLSFCFSLINRLFAMDMLRICTQDCKTLKLRTFGLSKTSTRLKCLSVQTGKGHGTANFLKYLLTHLIRS